MVKLLLLLVVAAVAVVLAEPPVGRQYLPPGRGGHSGRSGALSSRYGAPARSSSRSSLSSRRLGSRRGGLSTRYGAPGGASSRFGAAPSPVYGAPSGGFGGANAPSTQYGAPFGGSGNGFGSNSPSTQYGAPFGDSNGFNALSTQYGAPGASNGALSSSYSAPGASSRFSGAPSPVYGAPGRLGDGGFGGYPGGRYTTTEDPLAEPANYEYSYEVNDVDSGSEFGHQENREEESALGEYRVLLPDGRTQIVEYEADQEGYKPNIRYEEAGPYAASQRNGGGNGFGPY